MESLIGIVNWVEKSEMMDNLLRKEETLTTHPMDQGFEAEVIKISSHNESFVMKVWNQRSKPDIRFQYRLLNTLVEQGIPVPKPLGWGLNPNSDQVLLTTFDGMTVHGLKEKKMADIAGILAKVHQIRIKEIRDIHLPKYDFIDYFYPGVRAHDDIYHALVSLVSLIQIKQEWLIHGDFHLGNIVEDHNRYTVIDWTNGQLGDPRYDLAWSLVLQQIYIPERYVYAFRSAYLLENDIQQKELEVFEALACLRWILLHRSGGTPVGPDTVKKVKGLIKKNPFLKELNLAAFV